MLVSAKLSRKHPAPNCSKTITQLFLPCSCWAKNPSLLFCRQFRNSTIFAYSSLFLIGDWRLPLLWTYFQASLHQVALHLHIDPHPFCCLHYAPLTILEIWNVTKDILQIFPYQVWKKKSLLRERTSICFTNITGSFRKAQTCTKHHHCGVKRLKALMSNGDIQRPTRPRVPFPHCYPGAGWIQNLGSWLRCRIFGWKSKWLKPVFSKTKHYHKKKTGNTAVGIAYHK